MGLGATCGKNVCFSRGTLSQPRVQTLSQTQPSPGVHLTVATSCLDYLLFVASGPGGGSAKLLLCCRSTSHASQSCWSWAEGSLIVTGPVQTSGYPTSMDRP